MLFRGQPVKLTRFPSCFKLGKSMFLKGKPVNTTRFLSCFFNLENICFVKGKPVKKS